MRYLKRIYVILQFLTTIPLRKQIVLSPEEFGKGLVFAPVVGLIIGGILFGVFNLLNLFFTPSITALLLLAVYVMITGGLHIDGLADAFDAIFSRRSREQMLEIMKDSRIGTMGVLAIVFLLGFDYIFFDYFLNTGIKYEFLYLTLPLFPVGGRVGSITCVSLHKYARKDGMTKSFIDYCNKKELIMSVSLALIIFILIMGKLGFGLFVITFIGAIIISEYFSRKLDGITGDIAGAVCELTQIVFFLAVYVCDRLGWFL